MAKFQEVIQQFHRMCKSGNCIEIKTCPLMKKPSTESCIRYAFENPCDFENIVMAWAAEHPEPVYPTWVEWLNLMGLTKHETGQFCVHMPNQNTYAIKEVDTLNEAAYKPISADLARKLGIEPKEG